MSSRTFNARNTAGDCYFCKLGGNPSPTIHRGDSVFYMTARAVGDAPGRPLNASELRIWRQLGRERKAARRNRQPLPVAPEWLWDRMVHVRCARSNGFPVPGDATSAQNGTRTIGHIHGAAANADARSLSLPRNPLRGASDGSTPQSVVDSANARMNREAERLERQARERAETLRRVRERQEREAAQRRERQRQERERREAERERQRQERRQAILDGTIELCSSAPYCSCCSREDVAAERERAERLRAEAVAERERQEAERREAERLAAEEHATFLRENAGAARFAALDLDSEPAERAETEDEDDPGAARFGALDLD